MSQGKPARPAAVLAVSIRDALRRAVLLESLEVRQLLTATINGSSTVYSTIQAAVNAAATGGTVTVTAGTYPETVTVAKRLTINGAQAGMDARGNRRAAASASESVVTGASTSSGRTAGFYVTASDVTINGFTVQGNTNTGTLGAGIVIAPSKAGTHIYNNIIQNNVSGLFLSSNSSSDPALIQYNVFRANNNAGANGGRGIYTDGTISGGTLTNVTIDSNAFFNNRGSTNTTGLEAALAFEASSASTQTNLRITNNVFDGNGKATLFFNSSNLTLTGNVVTHTLDWYSGSFRFEGNNHNATIQNNTIYDNTGVGVAVDSKGVPGDSSGFVVTGNNIYGNSTTPGDKLGVVVNGDQYTGTFDARNNYWGNATGPSGDGPGTGDAVYGIATDIPTGSYTVAKGGKELYSPFATAPIGNRSTPYAGLAAVADAPIQAEDYNHGGDGIGYHDTTPSNGPGQYRTGEGVDIETNFDTGGGYDVTTTAAGEWLAYGIQAATAGNFTLDVRYANGQTTAGLFHIEVDGVAVGGTLSATPTGGTQTWKTLTSAAFTLTAGAHTLRLVMDAVGSGGTVAAFNWIKLNSQAASTVPATPTNLTAVAAASAVTLAWQDNATNDIGYAVEREVSGGSWSQIASLAAGTVGYTDTTAAASTAYVYRVRALGTNFNSAYSNTATVSTPAASTTTYLSDLPWVSATNGWGPVERDQSNGGTAANDGGTITLNTVKYTKGLGVNSPSEIVYNLNGAYKTFLSDVGVDDHQTKYGTVVFQVYCDGVLAYTSGTMTATTATKSASVDVTNVKQLRLVVTDAGDGSDYDWADWANARLTKAGATPNYAAPTNLIAAASTSGPTQVALAWTNNGTDDLGEKVERSVDTVNFSQVAVAAAGSTSYVDTQVSAGTAYDYRIRTIYAGGDSDYSNTSSVKTAGVIPTFLSDLNPTSATNGWGDYERDMSNGEQGAGDGGVLTLNGVQYAKGLGAHANSTITYALGGAFGTFTSDVGVDDEVGSNGSVDFQVYGDGVLLFDSGVMTGDAATQSVKVSVRGVTQLSLVITDAGDGNGSDHADWAGAQLTA